jgi:hypothetical protein
LSYTDKFIVKRPRVINLYMWRFTWEGTIETCMHYYVCIIMWWQLKHESSIIVTELDFTFSLFLLGLEYLTLLKEKWCFHIKGMLWNTTKLPILPHRQLTVDRFKPAVVNCQWNLELKLSFHDVSALSEMWKAIFLSKFSAY